MKKSKFAHIVLTVALFLSTLSVVQASDVKTFTYFTGIGCPHCANVSPELHEKVNTTDGLVMVEYELYKQSSNAKVLADYSDRFGFNLAIPLVIYEPNVYDLGDTPILENLGQRLSDIKTNTVEQEDETVTWTNFDLNDFKGYPKIFGKDRVAMKTDTGTITGDQNTEIKGFLSTSGLDECVSNLTGESVSDLTVEYPGGFETYTYGIKIGSWTLLWRGNTCAQVGDTTADESNTENNSDISLLKIGTLAITDSINPCALSVLLMMLVAITTYHPKDKKQVLRSGLAFVGAVFITYFIYGILIIKAFTLIQGLSSIKTYLYTGLGIGAILLGLLELKDFFFYKPGGIGTEMPLFLRPKVQKIIARITSPLGAFALGMFVTLFLLPCTIGPYVILGGMLSFSEFLNTLPYLSFYNLIFILPMIIIILLVFFGTKNIKQINEWKEKNVKIMHLIIGVIFLLLGCTMVLGWF